jgi:hypothetical protein
MTERTDKSTDKPQRRVIHAGEVPGRPAMSEPDVVTGAEGWRRMHILVAAACAAAGIEMKVDRSVVRVYRNGERPER